MNRPGPRGTLYVDGQPLGEIQTLEVNIERDEATTAGGFGGLVGKTFTFTGRIEWEQPTPEEMLAFRFNLTPEQAAQLAVTIRQTAEILQASFEAVAAAVRSAIFTLQEPPGLQEQIMQLQAVDRDAEDLPKHKYERRRLPSQQGYNRTPYDRWRNSLGGGRRRR